MKFELGLDYAEVKHPYYMYKTKRKYEQKTTIFDRTFMNDYLCLTIGGLLIIGRDYYWDGASGVAINCEKNVRASLIHDALYQMIREGVLPLEFRLNADQMFYHVLRQDGMGWLRAKLYYRAVRWFGEKYCTPK